MSSSRQSRFNGKYDSFPRSHTSLSDHEVENFPVMPENSQTTCFQSYVTFVYVLALVLNLYKFVFMWDLAWNHRTYYIFPWKSTAGQKSDSNPWWLMLHLVTSLITVMTIGAKLNPNLYDPLSHFLRRLGYIQELPTLRRTFQVIFSVLVLCNCWHFGQTNYLIAILINAGLVGLSVFVTSYEWYFGLITLPVVFELGSIAWYLVSST